MFAPSVTPLVLLLLSFFIFGQQLMICKRKQVLIFVADTGEVSTQVPFEF